VNFINYQYYDGCKGILSRSIIVSMNYSITNDDIIKMLSSRT